MIEISTEDRPKPMHATRFWVDALRKVASGLLIIGCAYSIFPKGDDKFLQYIFYTAILYFEGLLMILLEADLLTDSSVGGLPQDKNLLLVEGITYATVMVVMFAMTFEMSDSMLNVAIPFWIEVTYGFGIPIRSEIRKTGWVVPTWVKITALVTYLTPSCFVYNSVVAHFK